MFAEAAPGKRKALGEAMARLFAAGRIKVEAYGKPSQRRERIVLLMISDFVRLAPIVPRPACVPHHFYHVPHGYCMRPACVLHGYCMGTAGGVVLHLAYP